MAQDDDRRSPIGYGRPPTDTQWSSTHQPQRRGRRPGTKGVKTELKALLNEHVAFKINGELKKSLPLPVVLRRMTMDAIAGKAKASRDFLELVLRVFGLDDLTDGSQRLPAADAALLAEYLASYLADQSSGSLDRSTDAGCEGRDSADHAPDQDRPAAEGHRDA